MTVEFVDGLLLPTLFLTNGLATAVAHNLNGLATMPWIAQISPNNVKSLATANQPQTQPSSLKVLD